MPSIMSTRTQNKKKKRRMKTRRPVPYLSHGKTGRPLGPATAAAAAAQQTSRSSPRNNRLLIQFFSQQLVLVRAELLLLITLAIYYYTSPRLQHTLLLQFSSAYTHTKMAKLLHTGLFRLQRFEGRFYPVAK